MTVSQKKPRHFRLDPDVVRMIEFIETLSPARQEAVLDCLDDLDRHPELPDHEAARRFKEAIGWASH